MTTKAFEKCLAVVLGNEGGFVDHPRDPGGMTNYGITHKTYSKFLKREATREDMLNMPMEHVRKIYKSGYWNKVKGGDLPEGVDLMIFDWGVNSGPHQSAKSLQRILGKLKVDGKIGPKTIKACYARYDRAPRALLWAIRDSRQAFYRSLRGWTDFGPGWTRRNKHTHGESIKMIVLED